MKTRKLNALKIKGLTKPGLYGDGGNLCLQVHSQTNRSWVFRYFKKRREHNLGLGSVDLVSLAEAREKALEYRKIKASGRDPLDVKRAAEQKAHADQAAKTFSEVAGIYIDAHQASWKNKKHAHQWQSTINTYAAPVFGKKLVRDVTSEDILNALKPIWLAKSETASRLRGRIEAVLGYAAALGWRPETNPASLKVLCHLLPAKSKIATVKHRPAMPYADVPGFIVELRKNLSVSARCLEFKILTVVRSQEVRGALWTEVDLEAGVWTIPAQRMKIKNRDHKVPLSIEAQSLLKKINADLPAEYKGFIFPGSKPGQALSDMALTMLMRGLGHSDVVPHGFRSTFKDWCREQTNFQNEVSEAALAHAIGDKVEQAYGRSNLFEKRRDLMDAWCAFCSGLEASNVIRLAGK